MKKREIPIDLYYWPGIQGRGEFVRLLLDDAGAARIYGPSACESASNFDPRESTLK